ncbi:MAG: hydroxyacid dehydrogenase [Deltaproteobacteria bacterium]|nr:hydroxyacid dehydrogenase [Deltaproteobacteria bacterium]MBU50488.1 hydroxyacid dehydrogenase [Deltaproteobacteria bacterium]|tara:strand:- start:2013 stop:3014 length:1002 start_codon:yes stop_codon:yes gene_type:complete
MVSIQPKTLHIHMLQAPTKEDLTLLQDLLPTQVHFTTGTITSQTPQFEILVAGYPSHNDLAHSKKLHSLLIPWAGIPKATRAHLASFPDLSIHNIHHNADAVAELACTLLMTAAKKIIPFDRSFRTHDWRMAQTQYNEAILLTGKTALILGYGHIGKALAKRLHGLGMELLATRRNLDGPEQDKYATCYPHTALHKLLPQSQALIVCLPLTKETHGLIGEKELQLLPKHALLVNVGRGDVVQEEPLFQALKSGHLFGAGLDVWYNYPSSEAERAHTPPSNMPFHTLDNVVLSPHRAPDCHENDHLRMKHLADVLRYPAEGKPMPNKMSLQRGY